MKHQPLQLVTAALILGYATLSSASEKSVTVFPAEGNKQCSDYSANNMILQMGTTSPVGGLLQGAENPRDADSTGEAVSYSVAGGTVVGFSASTTPIDYALLKSGRSISVIIYPSGGVYGDSDMRLTVGGIDQPITAISLCYGLGNSAPLPPPLKTTPSCSVKNALDTTPVSCEGVIGRALVCNFELDRPFFGLNDGSDSCCVCNSGPLTECNPDLTAGEPNSCIPADKPAVPTEVTTHIELNNDPYYCYTVGSGPRVCYPY